MKRALKIAILGIVIVAAISIGSSVESIGFTQLIQNSPKTYLAVTSNHTAATITLDMWCMAGQTECGYVTYQVKYARGSSNTATTVQLADGVDSWVHTNPDLDVTYHYKAKGHSTIDWSDTKTGIVYSAPVISSASFDESTNVVKLTSNRNIQNVTASSVCVYNAHQGGSSAGPTGSTTRCGTSSTMSGTNATVTIAGELPSDATKTSESAKFGAGAVTDIHGLDTASTEINLDVEMILKTYDSSVKSFSMSGSNATYAVTATWEAPDIHGVVANGQTIHTGYTLQYWADGESPTSVSLANGATSWTHTHTASGSYSYKMQATTVRDPGPWTDTETVLLATPEMIIDDTNSAVKNFGVSGSNATQIVTATWEAPDIRVVVVNGQTIHTGYTLQYWADGESPTSVSLANGATSWTHTHTASGSYSYKMQSATVASPGPWTDTKTVLLATAPTIVNATFDESTNTVTITANEGIQSVTASNVCVHNTYQIGNSTTYDYADRCGTSATVSGNTVTVTIDGELSDTVTKTSESILIGSGAVNNAYAGNAQVEIVLFST